MVRLGSGPYNLERFIEAQAGTYDDALAEITAGRKRSHWMWFIYPQLKGLGHSELANFYGIAGIEEARAYLAHPMLGVRLTEICHALLALPTDDTVAIFGHTDSMKLRSSMTLFAQAKQANPVFQSVLNKFYNGEADAATLQLMDEVKR